MSSTFGPSALVTPANALTAVRLLGAPLLVGLVVATGPATWLLAVLWLALSSTDGIDGIIARRMGATRSGAFLDPLADKFLVLGVLCALAATGSLAWFPVALICLREVAMSCYRSYAGRRGVSIPARPTAKVKTLVQDVVIFLALLPVVGARHMWLVQDLLWIAVAITLWTGFEYARDGRSLMARARPAGVATSSSPAPTVLPSDRPMRAS